ncbi:MAG: chemotaxis protein CheW [Fimbriimonadaceae bacterium]
MAETKYVIFKLDGERYGIPIDRVEQILSNQTPTRIPRTHKMVLGVFELRGETLAAVDLRTRLDFAKKEGDANYIIVSGSFGRTALRVDTVDGIEDFDAAEIDESPEMLKDTNDAFFKSIGRKKDQLTVLLDTEHLLPQDIAKAVSKAHKVAA